MLFKLVRKDLILHWKGIVPLLITATGLLVYTVLRDGTDVDAGFFLTLEAFLSGFAPIIIAAREDKLKTRVLTCSLPVDRTTAVGARYLVALLMFIAFTAFMFLVFLVIRGPSAIRGIFRPEIVFGMLTAYTLAAGLMMPFVERFGLVLQRFFRSIDFRRTACYSNPPTASETSADQGSPSR